MKVISKPVSFLFSGPVTGQEPEPSAPPPSNKQFVKSHSVVENSDSPKPRSDGIPKNSSVTR
jgi:hypothetical protein